MTVAKKLVASIAVLVALAAGAIAYGGNSSAHRAAVGATACAPSTETPVALVPGLNYDPATMIPRGIC